jgi:hypothetical protein
VSERPNLIFGAFLALAGAAAAALLIGLGEAGAGGAAGFAAVSAGLVSACVRFAIELRALPPALILLSVTAVASGVALVHALYSIWREQRAIRALPVIPLAASDYGDALLVPRGAEVGVLRSRRQGAFCAGLLRPRVVIYPVLLAVLLGALAIVARKEPVLRRGQPHLLKLPGAACVLGLVLGFLRVRPGYENPRSNRHERDTMEHSTFPPLRNGEPGGWRARPLTSQRQIKSNNHGQNHWHNPSHSLTFAVSPFVSSADSS